MFVRGKASTGKTTLTLRIAAEKRDRRAFYLNVSNLETEEAFQRARKELGWLARMSPLIILDNIHQNPSNATRLWRSWKVDRSSVSQLLLVATKIEHKVVTEESKFGSFEDDPENPPIEPRPTPGYLGRVMKHLYGRFAEATAAPDPPQKVLKTGCAMVHDM